MLREMWQFNLKYMIQNEKEEKAGSNGLMHFPHVKSLSFRVT